MKVEAGQSVPKSKVDASHFVPKSKVAGSWDPNALTWVEHQFYLTTNTWHVCRSVKFVSLQPSFILFIFRLSGALRRTGKRFLASSK